MPGVLSGKYSNLPVFYENYIRTYIERDVRRLLGNCLLYTSRGGLLEQQHDVLALEVAVRGAGALQVLEVLGELQHCLLYTSRCV